MLNGVTQLSQKEFYQVFLYYAVLALLGTFLRSFESLYVLMPVILCSLFGVLPLIRVGHLGSKKNRRQFCLLAALLALVSLAAGILWISQSQNPPPIYQQALQWMAKLKEEGALWVVISWCTGVAVLTFIVTALFCALELHWARRYFEEKKHKPLSWPSSFLGTTSWISNLLGSTLPLLGFFIIMVAGDLPSLPAPMLGFIRVGFLAMAVFYFALKLLMLFVYMIFEKRRGSVKDTRFHLLDGPVCPPWYLLIFLLFVTFSLFTKDVSSACATAVAAVWSLPFAIIGLGVIHKLTTHLWGRKVWLGLFYVLLFLATGMCLFVGTDAGYLLFLGIVPLGVIVLGGLEPWVRLRGHF